MVPLGHTFLLLYGSIYNALSRKEITIP